MKLTRKQLRRLIQEVVDGDGPLGKYVFPKEKVKGFFGGAIEGIDEPYTALENQLRDALAAHIGSSATPLTNKMAEEIIKIIINNDYPKIFKRYQKGKVYRGTILPIEKYFEIYGKEIPIPDKSKWYKNFISWYTGESKINKKNMIYTNKTAPDYSPGDDSHEGSFASSWSLSKVVSRNFAYSEGRTDVKEGYVSLLICADSANPNNFFIDLKPIYQFDFAADLSSEKEVIGFGDIQIENSYVIHPALRDSILTPWDGPLLDIDTSLFE